MNRKLTLTVLIGAVAMAAVAALLAIGFGPDGDQDEKSIPIAESPAEPRPAAPEAVPPAEPPATPSETSEPAPPAETASAETASPEATEPAPSTMAQDQAPSELAEELSQDEPSPGSKSPTPEAMAPDTAATPGTGEMPQAGAQPPVEPRAEPEPASPSPSGAGAQAPGSLAATAVPTGEERSDAQPAPSASPQAPAAAATAKGEAATAASQGQPDSQAEAPSPATAQDQASTEGQTPPRVQGQPESQPGATQPGATQPGATQPGATQLGALPAPDDDTSIELPAARPPSFDILRVEPNGDAVIAGRAEPGSRVVLEADGEPIAETRADAAGEWIIILDWALDPGSHQLSLRAESPRGETLLSDSVVVVAVPERDGRPAPQAAQVAKAPTAPPASSGEPAATATAEPAPGSAPEPAPEPAPGSAPEPAPEPAPGSAPEPASEPVSAPGGETQEARASAPLTVVTPRLGGGASQVLQVPDETGIIDRDLVLSAIEYDPDGQVIVSGRGRSGATIQLYIDNEPIGRTTAGEQGAWSLAPESEVATGLHRMRIDQLDVDGKVAARIETPFSRADALVELPENRFVIVQPGNSLWRIARRTYGEGVRYSAIYRSNQSQIRDPDLIYPGQIFLVPEVN